MKYAVVCCSCVWRKSRAISFKNRFNPRKLHVVDRHRVLRPAIPVDRSQKRYVRAGTFTAVNAAS